MMKPQNYCSKPHSYQLKLFRQWLMGETLEWSVKLSQLPPRNPTVTDQNPRFDRRNLAFHERRSLAPDTTLLGSSSAVIKTVEEWRKRGKEFMMMKVMASRVDNDDTKQGVDGLG